MKRLVLRWPAPLLVAFLTAACGGETNGPRPPAPLPPPVLSPPSPPPAEPAPASASASVTDTTSRDAAPPAPQAPPPSLTAGTPSDDPAPLPTVRIVTPAKDAVVKDVDPAIKLDVKNWPTAAGGSSVHLILDNRPYKAVYDLKKPVMLSELLGGTAVDYGQHVLVAFPVRANANGNQSVKTAGALAVQQFWTTKKDEGGVDLERPMLVYDLPQGEYRGDRANHVLIDFEIVNDTLSEGGDHVAITVTGPGIPDKLTASVAKRGTPYYLDDLPNGQFVVKVELVNKDGGLVMGAWNSTTRTISVTK